MLVLSRKANERVLIGQDITLTILDIRGGRVRVGIEAPANVQILREEVAQREAAVSGQHSGDVVADVAPSTEPNGEGPGAHREGT